MRNVFLLAKTLLKSGGLLGGGKENKRGRYVVPVALGFAFLSFALSIGAMTMGLYGALETLGQQSALLPLALGATSAVIFFFGIFYTISVMYHADDIQLLLYLPLRPWQILGGKFLTLIVYEYIFEAFILIPVLVAYAIRAAVSPLFIAYAAVLVLAAPVIALSMAAVIVMLVMRFTRFAKNKQVFSYVSSIIAIIVAVGFNVVIQTGMRSVMEDPSKLTSLAPVFSRIFPGTEFAANALISSESLAGLMNLLLYLACAAAAAAVFLLLGQALYFKGVTGVTEAAAKRRAISAEALTKETAGASVLVSYTRKELRLLVRSPIAFMNCVIINFIWPLVLLLMVFSSGSSMDMMRDTIGALPSGTVLAILVGASAFLASGNAVTSSAFSREGKGIYFMKYVPVPMTGQFAAKGLSGMLLSGVGILATCALALYFGVAWYIAAAALVLGLAVSAGASAAGLMIDAARPKLEWSNEQQAIKQNMNVLLHMLVGLALALAFILPVTLAHMELPLALAYTVVLTAVLCAALVRAARGSARRIAEMDV